MRNNIWTKRYDMFRYKRILKMQDDDVKQFFDMDGCGLEIEFGVRYKRESRSYIETGLRKLKALVGGQGRFVPDMTIGHDLNVEIVLMPMQRGPLRALFGDIKEILDFYDNFVFDAFCGIHANFRADEALKRAFFRVLVGGGYDSKRFVHSKYKMDFMDIVTRKPGATMTYDEYIDFQNRISAKYAGVNFLKNRLVEFRTLDLNWDDIEYVYALYEYAREHIVHHAIDSFVTDSGEKAM